MGEKDRFSLLGHLSAHYDELLGYLTRRLGNAAIAADVAQDTYLRLQAAGSLPEIENTRAYLFRVADNLAIDHLRAARSRERRFVPAEGESGVPSSAADPEASLASKQRLRLLEQAITALPPKCREVFLLHKIDGLSHGAIALRLGISRSMVEKHVMKALARCRDRLEGGEDGKFDAKG